MSHRGKDYRRLGDELAQWLAGQVALLSDKQADDLNRDELQEVFRRCGFELSEFDVVRDMELKYLLVRLLQLIEEDLHLLGRAADALQRPRNGPDDFTSAAPGDDWDPGD